MNGPLPTTRLRASPSASITSFGMIQNIGEAIVVSKGAKALLSVKTTVRGSGACTPLTMSKLLFCGETLRNRSNE